jgi:glycosyltransferase involved in cell wall biosynthesis
LRQWKHAGGEKKACALEVIPNGVQERLLASGAERVREDEDDVIARLGKMDYHPNEDAGVFFAQHVFPRLRSQYKSLRFMIVGLNPTWRVRSLANIPGVVVTGFLDDPFPLLRRAKVVVAPLRFGVGIKNKVLEAMAVGKAVVTTTVGAEGISGLDGVHYVIADGVEATIARVSELLADRDRRGVIGAAARDLVMSRYRWDVVGDKLLNLVRVLRSETLDQITMTA